MKRTLLWIGTGVAAAAAVALAVLVFCTCVFGNHQYRKATCTEPEVCSRCKAVRGEPLGHEAGEASCTEPSVCLRCGIELGDPKGHEWLPATCTEPEICARCEAAQGSPLGHDMTEPNYQTRAACRRCGYTEGEPLSAALSDRTLNELSVGVPAPYTTASYEDYGVDVTGTVEIVDFKVIDGDETFPAREGYEWHIATVRLVFAGDDAKKNGAQAAWTYGDYYLPDDDMAAREDENGLRPFAADWYGMRVQCWQKTGPYTEADWYDRELRFCWQEGVLVPKGYDGVLLIFYNYRLAKDATRLYLPASAVLDDTVPVFRMK